jgi:hypothetical protein
MLKNTVIVTEVWRCCHLGYPYYMSWFYPLSHPKVVPPVEGEPPRPANVKVLIEEEHVMDTLDTLQVVKTIRTIVVECMENGTPLP